MEAADAGAAVAAQAMSTSEMARRRIAAPYHGSGFPRTPGARDGERAAIGPLTAGTTSRSLLVYARVLVLTAVQIRADARVRGRQAERRDRHRVVRGRHQGRRSGGADGAHRHRRAT